MKSTIVGMLLAALAIGYFAVNAPPAQCQWCSPTPCVNSGQCNTGCVCMNPGPYGQCVSFD